MFNPDKFKWRVFDPKENIPEHVSRWLLDSQSLTHKLKDKYNDFRVNVLSQEQNSPYECELKLLGSTTNLKIIVREVELMGSERAVVNARSLIPITNDTKDILKIGSSPLGEILFNDPEIKRGHLEVKISTDLQRNFRLAIASLSRGFLLLIFKRQCRPI